MICGMVNEDHHLKRISAKSKQTFMDVYTKTLAELERDDWGNPEFPSSVVERCHQLRHKPIGQMSIEDLRVLILQQIGLSYLVPVALEILNGNPLAEGDCYPGDLLNSLLEIDRSFWEQQIRLKSDLKEVVQSLRQIPKTIESKIKEWGRNYD
jgi:hypothetical protein